MIKECKKPLPKYMPTDEEIKEMVLGILSYYEKMGKRGSMEEQKTVKLRRKAQIFQ